MDRKAKETEELIMKLTRISWRDPEWVRVVVLLMHALKVAKHPREQESAFLSSVSAHFPWRMGDALEMIERYDVARLRRAV